MKFQMNEHSVKFVKRRSFCVRKGVYYCNPVLCKLATMGNNITLVDNENTLKSFWLYSEVTGLRIQVQEVGSTPGALRQLGSEAMPSERGL